MKLLELISPLFENDVCQIQQNPDILDIAYDSRKVRPGFLFVCIPGSAADGHDYAEKAEKSGASAIIAQRPLPVSIPVLVVEDARKALAVLSVRFFGNPAGNGLTVIALTGTKGKTTTAHMIQSILEEAGHKTGMIGTIGVSYNGQIYATENTTPASYEIQRHFRNMLDSGCKYCVIEASSIGLKDFRIYGFPIEIGIFTNFSQDHIGGVEHKDMQEYMESKSILFKLCTHGVVNIDDPSWEGVLADHLCSIYSYGFDNAADMRGSDYRLINEPGLLGIGFHVSGGLNFDAQVGIPGKFNAYNALSAIAACHLLGISPEYMNLGLRNVKVKGRVEPVPVNTDTNFTLLIDYAHNALSMESLLETLREYRPKRLVCMFGAGGNRPKVRRYEMGEVCGRLADLSVVTEDNSRFENVSDIIADIITGLEKTCGKYIVIENRRKAIHYCIENAMEGDIIVLAGKGHEDYQETLGVKHHFDERDIVKECFN